MKTYHQFKTITEYESYLSGYYDACDDYAIWKDGIQYIGVMMRPLSKIKQELEYAFNKLIPF